MSRIGKKPIPIPGNVKIVVSHPRITVEGPKGKLEYTMPAVIQAVCKEGLLTLSRPSDSKRHMSLHGLARSIIFNMVRGVAEGFSKHLEIKGVGYRAQVQAKTLTLHLGFTHPINFPIPEGIVIETPKPTEILVKGIDKQRVGQVAANIRAYYKPEPYKGKGIRYAGEYVRKKVGKAVA